MAKKSVKQRTPRKIAGVKVPKLVRRGLDELMASKTGRAVVADAILAAGAALLATQAKKGSATRKALDKHLPESVAKTAKRKAAAATAGGSALSLAVGDATRAFIEALQRGKAEADARVAWPPIEESAPPAKTKAAPPAH